MKKQSVRRNRITGEPRKWVCPSNAAIDLMLEKAETWDFFARLAKVTGAKYAVEVMPPEIMRDLAKSDRADLEALEKFMNASAPLSPAQRKYCEAEGIAPQDFIRRLERGQK